MQTNPSHNDQSDPAVLQNMLVNELIAKKVITLSQVEAAFRVVPRHLFLPELPVAEAYTDRAIPTKRLDNRWVSSSSQPAIMAIMLEQLDLPAAMADDKFERDTAVYKILEIGAGTGYNAALMAHIMAHTVGERGQVISMDIDADIVAAAREHLAAAGLERRVRLVCADGGYGYAADAPYDRIILTVGAPDIMPAWWEQLRPGGRLVLPLDIMGMQESIAFVRAGDYLESRSIRNCGFMPLRGAFAAASINAIQVGPQPDLLIEAGNHPDPDAPQVYRWLTGPSQDRVSGVSVRMWELGGLRLYLALYGFDLYRLIAQADGTQDNLVPPLVRLGGEWQSISTYIGLNATGMVALTYPPGEPAPLLAPADPGTRDTFFPLVVRRFGAARPLAEELVRAIRAWQAAGRPNAEQLYVRAYPKPTVYAPRSGEYVVEKEWTRLVLSWTPFETRNPAQGPDR